MKCSKGPYLWNEKLWWRLWVKVLCYGDSITFPEDSSNVMKIRKGESRDLWESIPVFDRYKGLLGRDLCTNRVLNVSYKEMVFFLLIQFVYKVTNTL